MTDPKTDLRRHSLARRDLVSPHEAHEAASAVARRGLQLVEELAAQAGLASPVVSVYWPIRSELNTRPLIEALAARGLRVTLPVMHKVRHPLIFRDFAPGDDLVPLADWIEAPRGTRFLFPEGPLSLSMGFGDSRAWWIKWPGRRRRNSGAARIWWCCRRRP